MTAVRRYDILDTPPDGAFERITGLAARLLDVPIAIVSIVDTDRIWFKSHHGLDVDEIGRDPGLCASAVMQDGPWLVNDAASDARTLANPLVSGEMGLRFYAGIPLKTHDGHNLGTLCVLDKEPRELRADEVDTLSDLASLVVDEIELRLSSRTAMALEGELRRSAEEVARTLQETLLPAELPDAPGLEVAARYHVAQSGQLGGDFYDILVDRDDSLLVVGDACGKGTAAAALTGAARWTLRTAAADEPEPARMLDRLNRVMVGVHSSPRQYCTVAVAAARCMAADRIELTVALGGHPAPLLLRSDGSVEPVGSVGPIAGWRPDVAYSQESAQMQSGDVLVLFTDGLLEAVAGRGNTDDALLQQLLATLAGRSAEDIARAIDSRIRLGELSDDAAYLVARCT